jgi:hypothetical protein
MPPRKRMKQLIKAEPALDNSHDIQQQTSVAEVLVEEQDQARVMKEELLQATVQLADLKAHIAIKDSVIHAKGCSAAIPRAAACPTQGGNQEAATDPSTSPPVRRNTCSVCDARKLHHQHRQSRILFFIQRRRPQRVGCCIGRRHVRLCLSRPCCRCCRRGCC